MNPSDQRNIAAAVRGPNKNKTELTSVAISRDRGDNFTYRDVPTGNSIQALIFSFSGSFIYASKLKWPELNNTIFRCNTTNWSCEETGTINTGRHWIVNFAAPRNSDRQMFAVGVRRIDKIYADPAVFYYNGSIWNNITIEGSKLDTAHLGGAIAYISKGSINTVAVATSEGIMVPNGNVEDGSHTDWTVIADGLPVVVMMDMVYSAEDDRLVIATIGRGIWYVEKVSQLVWDNVSSGPQYRSLRV